MQKINLLIVIFFLSSFTSIAQQKNKTAIVSLDGNPSITYLNLNNISTVFENNGISDGITKARFIYPKGTGKTLVFQSGLIWSAFVDSQLQIGGTTYRTGLQGGWIDTNGNVISSNDAKSRIFRVRPDVSPGGPTVDLSVEANDEGKTESAIRTQYESDWLEWPAELGAPFIDKNKDGIYEPNTDVPGMPGAAQTIWFVANDQAPTINWCNSSPIGIEMQATIWGYNDNSALDNLLFRKYKLINKTDLLHKPKTFDNMYIAMWSDIDVGNYLDDLVGCDTLLNLGFGYNGSDTDSVYTPLPPPAVGFELIRGPLVKGNAGEDRNRNGIDDKNDFGLTENTKLAKGYINLPMTAFYFLYPRVDVTPDGPPDCGSISKYAQYNFMRGRVGDSGELFFDPIDSTTTTFVFPGNPVTGEGWIDGKEVKPDDRRLGVSTGPITMAPGDTQIVVVAEIAAGAEQGVTRLAAIDSLKHYSVIAKNFYDKSKTVSIENNNKKPALNFYLSQNYPNPFNPSTIISYHLSTSGYVLLKVFDILGNEVAVLVDKKQPKGNYEVEFDARSLSSGVYFYQLSTGRFIQTKKMILLR